ncbi:actinorhodin polyketide synthase acyl carrier protein [Kitasatospora herbaricolor]|uniref:Acyl carrier protein n=1 Tax=Kitasatospora herbaricolor TaxID=68217 RepID=A0ABZ1WDA4_9ACTN|nr:acyl carrier protein [Kitasatospora herbaricolor]MDQ0308486.1 act minimal PKS acyl carrier protein [Kitasatospora herbaricolor]GGV12913.1 actinorhodin polyketide synthase acyl carrier protein [Kitasatospora herbaricolor]
MATMEIDDLRRILVACAGEDDGIDLSGEIEDSTFQELGYDSLALMESAARITQEYGVVLPDEAVSDAATPRTVLAVVNSMVTAAA